MAIRHLIAAGSLAAIGSAGNVAAQPARASGATPVLGTFSLPTGIAYKSSAGLQGMEWSANRVTPIGYGVAR